MSSSSSTKSYESDNSAYINAFKIALCVMGALMALVLLRFFVNFCIDIVILGDFDSAKQSVSTVTRYICPWWHRRTQPEELSSPSNHYNQHGRQDVEIGMTIPRSISMEERKTMIKLILPSDVLSSEDIKNVNSCSCDGEGSSCCKRGVCSICLVDFEVGDRVVNAERCSHMFHQACIVEWLGTHGTDCPNCRTEMISADTLASRDMHA